MIDNCNKKWQRIAMTVLIIAVLGQVFFNINIVNAQTNNNTESAGGCFTDIGCHLKNALNGFLNLIAGAVAYISAAFVWLAAFLVNFSFNMNLRLKNDGVIGAGWSVTNALANLGFVLAIIIIAFATVLRFQSYNYKQTLFKLIAAALLVNFSLFIAFVFIDFSNVLTSYFLQTSGSKVQIAGSLSNAMRVQSVRETATSTTVASIGQEFVTGIFSIIFQVVFNIIIIITFLALAVMLGIRYIALSILLILAPLAWLFWILPFTQKWWHQWWESFIKWVIFAPAVSLFIYIAIQTVNTMNTATLASNDAKQGMESAKVSFIADILGKTANMAVVVGILLGGLITANKMGIAGAAIAYGAATGATKSFGGWVGRKTGRIAKSPFTPASERMEDWATSPKKGAMAGVKRAIGSTMIKVKGSSIAPGGTSWLAGKAGGSVERYLTNPKTLAGSILMGAAKGSGLLKGKYAKDWEDENGHIKRATSKPKDACTQCGSAKWTELKPSP